MADASGAGSGPGDDALEGGWRLQGMDSAGRPLRLMVGDAEIAAGYLGVTVGRHPTLCQRVIDDPGISRRHFRIGRAATGPFLEDVNSLNGTSVDGVVLTPFTPAPLRPGQTLVLGHVRLEVSRFDGNTGGGPGTGFGVVTGPGAG